MEIGARQMRTTPNVQRAAFVIGALVVVLGINQKIKKFKNNKVVKKFVK
jgi:hypothetical protein